MAGGSVVHYCLSNISANSRALGSKRTWGLFHAWFCAVTLERVPIPFFGKLVRCPPMGSFFYETMLYFMLPASIYVRNMPVLDTVEPQV